MKFVHKGVYFGEDIFNEIDKIFGRRLTVDIN